MAQDRVLYEDGDLRAFLDGPTLRRVWRRLWLPGKVRALWESRFTGLAQAA